MRDYLLILCLALAASSMAIRGQYETGNTYSKVFYYQFAAGQIDEGYPPASKLLWPLTLGGYELFDRLCTLLIYLVPTLLLLHYTRNINGPLIYLLSAVPLYLSIGGYMAQALALVLLLILAFMPWQLQVAGFILSPMVQRYAAIPAAFMVLARLAGEFLAKHRKALLLIMLPAILLCLSATRLPLYDAYPYSYLHVLLICSLCVAAVLKGEDENLLAFAFFTVLSVCILLWMVKMTPALVAGLLFMQDFNAARLVMMDEFALILLVSSCRELDPPLIGCYLLGTLAAILS